jgi:hypothetical protein
MSSNVVVHDVGTLNPFVLFEVKRVTAAVGFSAM